METDTLMLYAAVALFVIAYSWTLSYHSKLSQNVMVARIRQLDCEASPLETDTLRYQLFSQVGPEASDTTSLVVLKQFSLIGLSISGVLGLLLARGYYAAGHGLWIGCVALSAVSFALLVTTFYTLGEKFTDNALFSPILQRYAANRAAVVDLLDKLNKSSLLNQLARNASAESANASSVRLADDEPNSVLGAAAATGRPAPAFSISLYQLQLRLLQRIKNVRGIVSAKSAATYLNNAPGAELFSYLQLNADGDYALLTGIVPVFSGPGTPMKSYDLNKFSADDTQSDLLQVNTTDKPTKDAKKLNYTAEALMQLRRALDELVVADAAPYAEEFAEYQKPLTRMLYLAPIILLFFVFKWYVYRSSRFLVTLAAAGAVTLYIIYYSYFG
jgi:hypothetical protein